MAEVTIPQFMRFERARIIGARALQIAMGAPIILEAAEELLDPVRTADREFEAAVIPITVHRPNMQPTRPSEVLPPPPRVPAKVGKKGK